MLLYQQSVTLRTDIQLDCTQTLKASWKEQWETERWASNCLTFYVGSQAERVDKDELSLIGES